MLFDNLFNNTRRLRLSVIIAVVPFGQALHVPADSRNSATATYTDEQQDNNYSYNSTYQSFTECQLFHAFSFQLDKHLILCKANRIALTYIIRQSESGVD